MKSVLCYGDSNTWGFVPGSGERFAPETRWTGVLQRCLGPDFRLIEEGLNGRTTVWDDPLLAGRNGSRYLVPCLESHKPLDLVIVFLGLNDLKRRFSASAGDVARGVGVLIRIIAVSAAGPGGTAPATLVVAPPPLGVLTGYAEAFEGSAERSARVSGFLREVALECGCIFADAADHALLSDIDGLHFDAAGHKLLGEGIAQTVLKHYGR